MHFGKDFLNTKFRLLREPQFFGVFCSVSVFVSCFRSVLFCFVLNCFVFVVIVLLLLFSRFIEYTITSRYSVAILRFKLL